LSKNPSEKISVCESIIAGERDSYGILSAYRQTKLLAKSVYNEEKII